MTAIYSLLHMLVDGVCALAMFGHFVSTGDGQFYFLVYNFCAFALQMPLGVLLDFKKELSFCFAALGVLLTIVGAITHPVLLGLGNALFHVGGGVGVIGEDKAKNRGGRNLGIFVAPGALGLYLGTVAAKKGFWQERFAVTVILLIVLVISASVLYNKIKRATAAYAVKKEQTSSIQPGFVLLGISCFLVVILRSYIGMAVSFPWKQEPILALVSVLAVVCGKAAGGFLAAGIGYKRTAVITLGIAALGYLGLNSVPLGLIALFAFNMTMPMTLYLLICALPKLPGFSFGLLTFGLFLGFLPTYFGLTWDISGQVLGCVGSILSMVILLIGIRKGEQHESVSD